MIPCPTSRSTRASFGTDLAGGGKYNNLINIKGAKSPDLYRGSVKIDDADDLKTNDVKMSIILGYRQRTTLPNPNN